jgi:hypothetical protein
MKFSGNEDNLMIIKNVFVFAIFINDSGSIK